MADDPITFIKDFEKKFKENMEKPRMEFLIHFRPREFHYYLLIIAEIKANYRQKSPFYRMIRKFPLSHWHETVLDLLKRFYKKREKDPEQSGVENGMSVVKAVCREFPEFFADHLDQLFVARIDFPGHATTYMWQQFGAGYQSFLLNYVRVNEDDYDEQCRALSHALLSQVPKLVQWAKGYIRNHLKTPKSRVEGVNLLEGSLNYSLHPQGLEWRDRDLVKLYPNYTYHLTFPYKYLHAKMEHETFRKHDSMPGEYTFGGAMVADNANGNRTQVQHLICLDPIPDFLNITGLNRLLLACDMDLTLHTPGETYQQHRPNGSVVILGDTRDIPPSDGPHYKPQTPFIKSAKVLLSNQGPAWYYQKYGKEENYYRLGGPPVFISGVHYPICTSCGRTMSFLLGLDSHLPRTDDVQMEWGIDGMAYVYWCDNCKISAIHWCSD